MRLVEQTTASWEFWFGLLEQFVERNGRVRIPRSCTVDGYKLGDWVNNQRAFYSRGILDADRQHRLEELPGWSWDPFTDQWEEGFSRLLEYLELHGDARVPQSTTVDGYRLGGWVTIQRTKHAKGTLDADRQRRLQDLPGWTWKARSSS